MTKTYTLDIKADPITAYLFSQQMKQEQMLQRLRFAYALAGLCSSKPSERGYQYE